MRRKVTCSVFLFSFVICSVIPFGIISHQGRIFAQTLPFTYIKPPASNISLFIVTEPLLALEAEALILSLGGTIVSAETSTTFLPYVSSPDVQIFQISISLSPAAGPPPEIVQFTATFPDPYAACPILSSSPAACYVGVIISPFYGTATGRIQRGGAMDGEGTHHLIDEITGDTICILSIRNPLFLITYPGALAGAPVTVSGTFTPLVEWFPPYFKMEVDDISFPSGVDARPDILSPLLPGFGLLPFPGSILNQTMNFINPVFGLSHNFLPLSIQLMPLTWPGISPWNGGLLAGLMLSQPIIPSGLSFLYPFIGYDGWPEYSSPPDFDHSDWIWTSPTTAHNPYLPPGIQQTVFVDWAAGYEQESPYYQQNFDEIYSPSYVPGIGTVYPYQSTANPLSPTGFSTLIPDYGWWPNISLGGFFLL